MKHACVSRRTCAAAHAYTHALTQPPRPPPVMRVSGYRIGKLRPKPKIIKLVIHETAESTRRKLFHLCGRKSLVVADYSEQNRKELPSPDSRLL